MKLDFQFLQSDKFEQNREVMILIGIILGVLVFATVLFYVLGKLKPGAQMKELKMRTKSWWVMASIFVLATLLHPIVSYLAFALLSFAALRELTSISKNVREEDRRVIIWCYLAIPLQYYFAYNGWFNIFIIFIPVIMHVWIPFVLVIRGFTTEIGRAMSVMPMQLMLTVFSLSHLAFLLSLPELEGFNAGGRGLLLYVVFLTEMNDVFQFTWGKLLGRTKIIEKISPNKTWEGFVGGVLTTTIVGYFLRFLTPLTGIEALVVAFSVACSGFIGDIIVSAVKRDIGLKDTGTLIPGHGGILDRIDSLAIAAPIFFYLVYNLYYV
jgi:phosphatidate cytidylyltransferase